MRANNVVILVGAPKTGKTTIALEIIKESLKKVLIYDLNREKKYREFKKVTIDLLPKWKKGVYTCFTDDPTELMYTVYKWIRNATVVFEDATAYLNKDASEYLRKILVSRRHMNLDLIFSFHSLNQVPPMLYEMSNYIVLKKTNDNPQKVKGLTKLPNAEEVIKAFHEVNKSKDRYKTITIKTNV